MKYKISLQMFLVLALVFFGSSRLLASEVTGTLSSGSGEVSGHGTSGSLSGSVTSSNTESNTNNSGSSSTGTTSGTVTNGTSSSTSSGSSGEESGSSTEFSQSAANSTGSDNGEESFISSDGTALDPSLSNLAFGDFGTSSSSDDPSFGDFGSEVPATPAQVIASGVSMSTWVWAVVLGLLGIAALAYLYVRSKAPEDMDQGMWS